MTLPRARHFGPFRFLLVAVSAAFLWMLSACSDGPDKTGLEYLQSQNIKLSTPLYHFVFKNFPIDSVFPTELTLNHFGESLLVVGRDGPFTAAARMGFQITTQAQRDSIYTGGLNLRLIALPPVVNGYRFLKSSTANHDSLTLLIEAFAWNDTLGVFTDSLAAFHRRLLASFTPFSTQDSRYKVRDTARIALKGAYADGIPDTLQICALKHLRERMNTDTLHNWQVFLEISPLTKAGVITQDSGMFRFVGENGLGYDPALLLGTYTKGLSAGLGSSPTVLIPYTSGGLPGVNYQVVHSGSPDKLLYGVSRGINLRLNRDSLMNLIKDSLGKRDTTLIARYFSSAQGEYDSRFYVPYAELHLPLADSLARVDGNFALDMQMASDVDSLDPQSTTGLIPVNVGDSLTLYPTQVGSAAYTGQLLDTMICYYRKLPTDTNYRQVIVHWVKDASVQDTVSLAADGKRHELGLKRHSGWLRPATLGFYPNASNVQVEVYFNIGSGIEPNGFIDPSTRVSLTDIKSLSRRFRRPGATELDLRATHGITALLNRAAGVVPEFLVRPADHNAFDTVTAADTTAYTQIYYPVMGEVGFPKVGGKLRVTVDVYLYPLGK